MSKRKHLHNLTILTLTGNGNLVVSFVNQNKSRILLRGSCLLQHLTLWSLSCTWKDELFFILNRIKGNDLDLAYILWVLCCHCRRSQGWGLRLFVIMCGVYVPSYLLVVCPVPHVNFFLVYKWSPEFGSRRSELVSSLMNAYS